MVDATPVTIAYGDGIGPEIMAATLRLLRMNYANIAIESMEMGERLYDRGVTKGIYDQDIEALQRSRVLLLAPVIVPEGNIHPRETLHTRYGFARTAVPQTPFAEYALAAAHYTSPPPPAGEAGWGCADTLPQPLPLVGGELQGSPPASGRGDFSLFESTQSPMPDLAGQDQADPSPLIHAGVLMLLHLQDPAGAQRIHNAWLRTVEEGIRSESIGTQAFADAVAERLGALPQTVAPVRYTG